MNNGGNMKIIVTGGAGFIGSHIVDKLIAAGNETLIIDDLSSGKKENINPQAKFFDISITDYKIEEIFKRERPDYVIHQAAQVYVIKSLKDPIFDANVNILGTLNILENCRKYGVKKIIYGNSGGAGSGEPMYLPMDEEHQIKPICHYGISKHTAEHYLYLYSKIYGLKYTSLRYSNVYGPRQDPFGEGGVVAIFSHQLLHDKIPTIFGDGKQTRDFIYVEDVADANIISIEKGNNDYFNVSMGLATSVNDLFQMIKDSCNSDKKANYAQARKGEIINSVLSNEKIKRKLGWKPKMTIKDGLKKTAEFFKNG